MAFPGWLRARGHAGAAFKACDAAAGEGDGHLKDGPEVRGGQGEGEEDSERRFVPKCARVE